MINYRRKLFKPLPRVTPFQKLRLLLRAPRIKFRSARTAAAAADIMTDDDRKMRHAHVSSSRFTSGRLSNYVATRTQFRRTSSRNNRARAPDLEARVGRSRRRLARSGSLRFRLPPIERMRASTRGALAPFHQRKSVRAGLRRKRRARVSFSGRRERERGGPYPSPEAFSTSPQGLDCFLFPSTRAHMAARHIRPS